MVGRADWGEHQEKVAVADTVVLGAAVVKEEAEGEAAVAEEGIPVYLKKRTKDVLMEHMG